MKLLFTSILFSLTFGSAYSQIDKKAVDQINQFAALVDTTIAQMGYAFTIGCGDWGSNSTFYDSLTTFKSSTYYFADSGAIEVEEYYKNELTILKTLKYYSDRKTLYHRRIYRTRKNKLDQTLTGDFKSLPRKVRKKIKNVL